MLLLLLALLPVELPPDRVRVVWDRAATPSLEPSARRLDMELERALPWLEAWTGRGLRPDVRLTLHLHATVEPYRNALRDAGIARVLDGGAVTLWGTTESHVVVQPCTTPEYLDAVGQLPELTLQLALHELVHQFMERSGAFPTAHQPLWYAEGMAEALSLRALERLRAETLLAVDARARLHEARDELLALPELLADAFAASGLERRGLAYAQCGSLFAFLDAGDNEPWHARLRGFEREMHELPRPGAPARRRWSRGRLDQSLRRHLGDLTALDAAWRATLEAVDGWRQLERSAQWHDGALVVAAFAWAERALARAPTVFDEPELRFDFQFLGEPRDVVVFLGTDPRNGLELYVGFRGEVTLVANRGIHRDILACTSVKMGAADRWHGLALVRRGDLFWIELDGAPLFDVALPDDIDITGRGWGVGVTHGAARFHGLPARARSTRAGRVTDTN
ncbi:MAG: hypothetical protein WD226_02495 [Planctomycetota bacterium]